MGLTPKQKLIEKVERLQTILVSRAQYKHEEGDEREYQGLRTELLSDLALEEMLPRFVRTCRTLSEFWDFVKSNDLPTYQSRRIFIRDRFHPLLIYLESPLGHDQLEPSHNTSKTDVQQYSRPQQSGSTDSWQISLERADLRPTRSSVNGMSLSVTLARTRLQSRGRWPAFSVRAACRSGLMKMN